MPRLVPALLALLLAAPLAPAQQPPPPAAPAPSAAAGVDPLHAPFDVLLARHVRGGRVDYDGLAGDTEALDAYLAALAAVDDGPLDRAQTLALWINAYNAATLRLILDHRAQDPELASIKDIPRGRRWLARRWTVAGRRVSLDAIEHEILRPLGEPRIHMAINCASHSCPDLAGEAYHAPRLDAQLDAATRRFLADRSKGARTVVDEGFFGTDHELHVSALFDWFEEDFEAGGGVVAFVRRYGPADTVAFIERHRDDLDLEHLDYDWSLNALPRAPAGDD